jgi:hypothetical protein
MSTGDSTQLTPREAAALRSATALNRRIAAVTFGVLGALGFALTSVFLLLQAEGDPDLQSSLLSLFFFGYRISWGGVWIGALWGLAYGALLGALLYQGYASTIKMRLQYTAPGAERRRSFRVPILRIYGPGLGAVLGAVTGLQLFLVTAIVFMTGRAEQSRNAQLLAHYLPGYNISIAGGLIGAIEIFVVIFLASLLLGFVYNTFVDWRQSHNRRGV